MYKVIPHGSFDFGMPAARLVDLHRGGVDSAWLEKRAAVLTREIAELRPRPGHSYVHLISLGSMEHYGCNRNGDAFPYKSATYELPMPKGGQKLIKLADGLSRMHATFMQGHVFKHHQNDNPEKSIGKIAAEAYNPEMHRGELIIEVPHGKEWDDDLQKLASGQDIAFSMSMREPHDTCSACGNQATSRARYCDHLRDHMTEILKSGHQVFAINDVGSFFDISKVMRPADRIAFSLRKVAELLAVGGAALAEELGMIDAAGSPRSVPAAMSRKVAAAEKLSAMEKRVGAAARGEDNTELLQQARGCPSRELNDDEISGLKSARLGPVLGALADAKICLSVRDFARLVQGPSRGPSDGDIGLVERMLPDLHSRLSDGDAQSCAADGSYDSDEGSAGPLGASIPRHVRDLIGRLMDDHSLAEGPVRRRITIVTIRGLKPETAQPEKSKVAVDSTSAYTLAREYAKYRLAFLAKQGADAERCALLTVLRGCVRFVP